MTEVVEYSLVVLVSALFISGSVVTYDSFSSFASGVQLRAAASTLGGLALEAMANGTATASVTIPSSVVRCGGGVLTVSSDGMSEGQNLAANCDFSVTIQGGAHRVRFSYSESLLSMAVS